MCLAIPSKITHIENGMATIDVDGVQRQASLLLLEDAGVDDYVIVHAGFAIHKIDEAAAMETLKFLKEAAAFVEGGGGDPGSGTTLTSEELAIAIADTETLRSDVAGLSRSDIGNGDKNKLVRQVDKVLDSLGALDSGTALFNLEVFRTLVTSYGIDGKLDPILASGFSTQAQDITDFIIEKQND